MRIAVIGAGPRGLFAVERLWAHLPAGPPVEVVVFDPQPPGVGAAYATDQPPHLRLNVNASIVSAAWPGESTVASFNQWRVDNGESEPLEPFPPRSRVGEYLGWFWRWLLQRTPDGASLTHRPTRVSQIDPGADRWLVDGEPFDEVLLATGHERTWPGALTGKGVVPAVFPTTQWLTAERIPPGCRVAIRGAALTFIDAAITLTEGRGGSFDGQWQTGFTYRPSGLEPAVIWPVTRSGRWMDPKPQPGSELATPDADVMERARREVLAAPTREEALAVVVDTAVRLGGAPAEIDELLGPLAGDASELLRERLSAMAGAASPGTAWALGHAWRGLYDALRERFEGTDADFGPFADLAGRLERVAFGPPPLNAAKIVALIDAGIIDPSRLGPADDVEFPADADVVIDAVLPPPGVVDGSLAARLVEDGHASTPPGRRGLAVGPDASCLAADGTPVPGLAAIGRVTEDVVIGNDTLNRALHPAVDGWARRIARSTRRP